MPGWGPDPATQTILGVTYVHETESTHRRVGHPVDGLGNLADGGSEMGEDGFGGDVGADVTDPSSPEQDLRGEMEIEAGHGLAFFTGWRMMVRSFSGAERRGSPR